MARYRAVKAAAVAAVPDLAACEQALQSAGSPVADLARRARERIESAYQRVTAPPPPDPDQVVAAAALDTARRELLARFAGILAGADDGEALALVARSVATLVDRLAIRGGRGDGGA